MIGKWMYMILIAGLCGCINNYTVSDEPHAMLFRFGCYKDASVSQMNTTELPHNSPGTCLAYCQRNNLPDGFIYLQRTRCICSNESPLRNQSTNGCSNRCPGHVLHFCGNLGFSAYKIEYTSTVNDSTDCFSYLCGTGYISQRCDANLTTRVCADDLYNGANCSVDKHTTERTWEESLKSCNNQQLSLQYTNNTLACSLCGQEGIGSNEFWVGVFGQWAPPQGGCTPPIHDVLAMGYLLDRRTMYFNCSRSTHYCLYNGTWTLDIPACALKTTPKAAVRTSMPVTKSLFTRWLSKPAFTSKEKLSEASRPILIFEKTSSIQNGVISNSLSSGVTSTVSYPKESTELIDSLWDGVRKECTHCLNCQNYQHSKDAIIIDVIIGVCAAAVLLIVFVVLFIIFKKNKKKSTKVAAKQSHNDTPSHEVEKRKVSKQTAEDETIDNKDQKQLIGPLPSDHKMFSTTESNCILKRNARSEAHYNTVDKTELYGYTETNGTFDIDKKNETLDRKTAVIKPQKNQPPIRDLPEVPSARNRHEKQMSDHQDNSKQPERDGLRLKNDNETLAGAKKVDTKTVKVDKLPPIQLFGKFTANECFDTHSINAEQYPTHGFNIDASNALKKGTKNEKKRKKKRKLTDLNINRLVGLDDDGYE